MALRRSQVRDLSGPPSRIAASRKAAFQRIVVRSGDSVRATQWKEEMDAQRWVEGPTGGSIKGTGSTT